MPSDQWGTYVAMEQARQAYNARILNPATPPQPGDPSTKLEANKVTPKTDSLGRQ